MSDTDNSNSNSNSSNSSNSNSSSSNSRKATIPKALREQVWIQKAGPIFQQKCPVRWCQNTINVFDFQTGHNVPESKGGATRIDNLIPICGRCNLSMSNNYTIEEWSRQFEVQQQHRTWYQFWCCINLPPPTRNAPSEPQATEATEAGRR